MFNEKTVKLFTDLPLAIINSADSSQDETLLQPRLFLKYAIDGNLQEIKSLCESNKIYLTEKYLEVADEVKKYLD